MILILTRNPKAIYQQVVRCGYWSPTRFGRAVLNKNLCPSIESAKLVSVGSDASTLIVPEFERTPEYQVPGVIELLQAVEPETSFVASAIPERADQRAEVASFIDVP